MITIADVDAARRRIAPHIRRTPIMALAQTRDLAVSAGRVTLKLECLQASGSFKARGAMNRLLGMEGEPSKAGLVTASGGNHGLAVARTAYVAGIPAKVFLPRTVSPEKVEKLKQWKAHIEIVGHVFDQANAAAMDYAGETGALYIHPFADPLVVAGQGTLGLDILDEIEDVDTILVAIGGGGLIAGLATAVKARKKQVRIIGIQATGAPSMKASLEAGHVVTLPQVTTKVATLAAKRTDERVFELIRGNIDHVVLVSDEEMEQAARWLWFECGVAADLSGAASIAALRSGRIDARPDEHVCALICGAGSEGATS
ncbi:threonine dehydratase [Rhizobiales bacterium GAS191]|jgi:threonine dehydratase|nr:threonine dehydratase [Rhizobiales bacterium GAS113]SED68383.1 threonine dehydratase [Rhizobiales bacterium GAS191]SEE73571.1 threonine dehydratase [Rhizobiales bacterium GAS188]